jgi:quercetin dioxygenase-like cupin family protein
MSSPNFDAARSNNHTKRKVAIRAGQLSGVRRVKAAPDRTLAPPKETRRPRTEDCTLAILGCWPFDERMFQYTALAKDKDWQPGPYPGVELLVLHRNDATGGMTVLRKFHAGTTVPAHVHPLANEFVYVLSGEWEESGVTYATGAFFLALKGERHGPHVAKTEVVSLTTFDGPLTLA